MFKRGRPRGDSIDLIWQDVEQIQDDYVRVVSRIATDTISVDDVGRFLLLLVHRSQTIERAHKLHQKVEQATESLPIEAEVILGSFNHIFTSCSVAWGIRDYNRIKELWSTYEDELQPR